MHRRTIAALATIALAVTIIPSVASADDPRFIASLSAGDEVWWDGGYVGEDVRYSAPLAPSVGNLDRCATFEDLPCFRFTVETTEAAARLRIGLDTPMRDDGFEMIITGPTGERLRQTNGNRYSMEELINNPPVGPYQITVAPYSAEYAHFRMRAKLEAAIPTPAPGTGDLLPNLRVTRLWEFTFAAPANPLNGLFPPDDVNPPLEAAGRRPVSCSIDEQLGFDGPPATRCLRYSFGLANIGEGNFDVRFTGDRSGDLAPMTQCVQQRDGSAPRLHTAGFGRYHSTHGHFHYEDIIHHTVLRVTDTEAGTLEELGTGLKIGYSPADQGMPQWFLFNQAPPGTSGSAGNCVAASANRVGMSPGWGDAYRYQRPGNFVEFDGGTDGYYVVRTTADPLGQVLESDESDNTSYAYIRVIGDQIDLMESGLGPDPWHSAEVFTQ